MAKVFGFPRMCSLTCILLLAAENIETIKSAILYGKQARISLCYGGYRSEFSPNQADLLPSRSGF